MDMDGVHMHKAEAREQWYEYEGLEDYMLSSLGRVFDLDKKELVKDAYVMRDNSVSDGVVAVIGGKMYKLFRYELVAIQVDGVRW